VIDEFVCFYNSALPIAGPLLGCIPVAICARIGDICRAYIASYPEAATRLILVTCLASVNSDGGNCGGPRCDQLVSGRVSQRQDQAQAKKVAVSTRVFFHSVGRGIRSCLLFQNSLPASFARLLIFAIIDGAGSISIYKCLTFQSKKSPGSEHRDICVQL